LVFGAGAGAGLRRKHRRRGWGAGWEFNNTTACVCISTRIYWYTNRLLRAGVWVRPDHGRPTRADTWVGPYAGSGALPGNHPTLRSLWIGARARVFSDHESFWSGPTPAAGLVPARRGGTLGAAAGPVAGRGGTCYTVRCRRHRGRRGRFAARILIHRAALLLRGVGGPGGQRLI
jgi:hypothetical protein